MAAGNVTVRLNLNAAGYSAAVTQAQRQMQKLAAEAKAMGHATVTSTQAASASIRVLEGGMTGNIRAAERFIATIPGVGKALIAAFPLVGGLALAGVFVKIGTEAAKFVATVNKAPQAITNSFRTLNLAAESSNDALAVTNDRLENEIAKLQGKPQNNLKLAIDEARVAADKLASALDADNSKIGELLERNHISAAAAVLGKVGTAGTEGSIRSYDQKISDLGEQRNTAVHAGDTAAVTRLDQAIKAAQDSAIQWAADRIRGLRAESAAPGGLNVDANVSELQGFQTAIRSQQDRQSLEATNNQLEKQKADLQAAKDLQEAQKKAAREALEAYKQAQEAIVAQWRKDLDEAKADNDMTLAQEAQFWVRRIEQSKTGTLSYLAALDEANKSIARMRQGNMHGQAEFDKTAGEALLPSNFDLSRGSESEGALRSGGADSVDYLRNLNQGIALQRQNAAQLAEASLRMAEQTGQISRLDAAQAEAALHTREYAAAVERLQDALAAIASDPSMTATQRAAATAGVNNQLSAIAGQRSTQVLSDQQAISSQQIGPAIQQALGQMVQAWKDMASQITQVLGRAVNGLNDNIVKAAFGQKTDFGKTFEQAGQGLLKTGLQRAEGLGLQALGIGGLQAADGKSEATALWVRMAGGAAGGGLLGSITGAAGSGSSGGGSGFTGLLGKFIQPFIQGHFAAGGDILGGYPAIVGENGPEMFLPRTSGRIIPNHQLGSSATQSHTYMIDARGATDPAAIHAAVARALPHAVAASAQAQHQMARRTPRGR